MGRIIRTESHKASTPSFFQPKVGPHGKVKTYKPIFDSSLASEDEITHVVEMLRDAIDAGAVPLVTILVTDEDFIKLSRQVVQDVVPLPAVEEKEMPVVEAVPADDGAVKKIACFGEGEETEED